MASSFHNVCLGSVIVALTATVSGQQVPTPPIDEAAAKAVTDEVFVAQAVRNGRAEIELSKAAITKAVRPDVKMFAQRMVDDHTKTNAELVLFARGKSMILPEDPSQMDKATLDKLEKVTGEAFDQVYVRQMVADHQRAVQTFTEHAEKGTDPLLKAWIAKTLPSLQHHLEQAREIEKKVAS